MFYIIARREKELLECFVNMVIHSLSSFLMIRLTEILCFKGFKGIATLKIEREKHFKTLENQFNRSFR